MDDVATSLQQITSGADDQNEKLREASDRVSELSAMTEEVASTVSEIALQSGDVTETAERGQVSAVETVERMETTIEQTEAVTEAADQINMLALNANIEAARASDSDGAGFEVVASNAERPTTSGSGD